MFDQKSEPYNITPDYLPATFQATEEFANCVVARAGAMAPFPDSVDQQIRNNWAENIYSVRSNVHFPEDYPAFMTQAPAADSDNDGMPDAWESANGTNPSTADDSLNTVNSKYTNIEVYINELADNSINPDRKCMPIIRPILN